MLFEFDSFNHLPHCEAWIDNVYKRRVGLNYAHSGKIRWAMDGDKERILEGPVAWWTWPGPRFTYGCKEPPGWNHYFVTFSGEWVDDLLQMGWLDTRSGQPFRRVADPGMFRDRMHLLQANLAERDEKASWAALLALLCELRKEQPDGNKEKNIHSSGLRELMTRIKAAPAKEWEIEEIARGFHLSPSHFRRLFREEAGVPFRQFCLGCSMDFAAKLIRESNTPLKAVAEVCGGSDVFQFSRHFKRHYGVPPGRYRLQVRLVR